MTAVDMSNILSMQPINMRVDMIYTNVFAGELLFFSRIVRNSDNTVNLATSTAYSVVNVTLSGAVINGDSDLPIDIKKYGNNGLTNRNSVVLSFQTTALSTAGSSIRFNTTRDFPFYVDGIFPTGLTDSSNNAINVRRTIVTGWFRIKGKAGNP